ncbi:MAG: hypothetical protein JSS86_11395 [Cyanobacteria bacterium SZAS LIN-2]|nr:hypothetical protein [Cyanobacteria bacterium SZAS LIN-2]MBS2006492.1 hypothetical protein [Cyanobacteria bacterium SZAS TMP-1]
MPVGPQNFKAASALSAFFALTVISFVAQVAAQAQSAQAALDPSVIDPVGKLSQISSAVAQSSNELSEISKALDQLNEELARVEKERPTKVTKASLDALQKRFKDTIERSYVVEKKVNDSLSKSQSDVENVRKALVSIQRERAAGTSHRPVMTDGEISECLKDLDDLTGTIKALKHSLTDDEEKPAAKPAATKAGANKNVKSKTAGSLSRGHISKGK